MLKFKSQSIALCCFIAIGLLAPPGLQADTPAGHPAEHLPGHIQPVTSFGQQPVWSRDGKKIYFLSKAFGDLFEWELKTKKLRPLTAHFRHHGYSHVRVLSNGKLLLSGPRATFDRTATDDREKALGRCWLSVLDPDSENPAVPLGVAAGGRPAVSRDKMKIAWTVLWPQAPELLKEGESQIFVGDVVEKEGGYELANQKMVVDSRNLPFTMHSLEVQDFRPGDENELLFTVFQFQGTEVFGVDLETKKTVNYTNNTDTFDAAASIFPDGKSIAIESARLEDDPWPLVDIYRLDLDGSAESERMTYFGAFQGYEATGPAISPDGNLMCFQLGRAGDERNAGHGLFLYDIEHAPKAEN